MAEDGIWVIDPDTNDYVLLSYEDIPEEAKWQLFKPIGGFVYPIGQFTQLDLAATPYYIKDWLPKQGRCLIYAPAKSGKSFLSLHIAHCIGSGQPFLGLPTNQGRVLLIQSEMGIEIVQKRIRDSKIQYPDAYIGTVFSLKVDTDAGLKMLVDAVDAIKPDVVILDPLYKMIAGDENETKDMTVIIDNLDKIISIYKCSIFLFHHSGKDLSKGGRGSSVLEDWVDSYLEMKRVSKEGEPLKVRITSKLLRHAELPLEPIVAQMDGSYAFHLLASEPTIKDKVREFIQGSYPEPVNRGDILKDGIGSNASVQDALNELVEAGVVERIGRGVYIWLPKE